MNTSQVQKNKKDAYILITGASSGIGREFAIQLAREGYPLILTARREARLATLAKQLHNRYGVDCVVLQADLSDEQACRQLLDRVKRYRLGMLVNNAGFGDCAPFAEADMDKEMEMIDVNVRAMHILTKLALERFREQSHKSSCYDRCILNVASSAGLLPAGPYMATYYATKAYIASLTQAIAREEQQAGSGIYVGCLCPGPVDTEFNVRANVKFALAGMSARECVRCALSGVRRRKTVIVPGVSMKLAICGARFFPRSVVNRMTSHQQMKKIYAIW